jgi:hypothetical protein
VSTHPSDTNQFDVARLARQNWEQDGCPPGREAEYYRMAEAQIEALRNLLAYDRQVVADCNAVPPPDPIDPAKPSAVDQPNAPPGSKLGD